MLLLVVPIAVAAFAAPGAADELPAPGDLSSVPNPGALHGGVEGSKSALVRIEVSAITEIVHVDHTTGDVDLGRRRYEVPVSVGTGVVTSADGIIATANANLRVDENRVGVHAANLLFTEQFGVNVTRNGGDPARRGRTTDAYWRDHLQHCYEREEHCILFVVPQYTVFTHTNPAASASAELVNTPTGPGDVALLRVGGGGGMPTARLAPDGDAADGDATLVGFTGRPDPRATPEGLEVRLDPAAAHVGGEDRPLAAALDAGLSGAPVIDRRTGDVLGLVYPHARGDHHDAGDPGAQLIAGRAVRRALQEADIPPTPSRFDAVFRRGVDQLASGGTLAATGSLREARSYYPSTSAMQLLTAARATDGAGSPPERADGGTDPGAEDNEGAGPLGVWWLIALGVLAVAVLAAVWFRRRLGNRDRPAATAPAQEAAGPVPSATESARTTPRPPASEQAPQQRSGNTATVARAQGRSTAYCTACGTRAGQGARFCGACGEPIG